MKNLEDMAMPTKRKNNTHLSTNFSKLKSFYRQFFCSESCHQELPINPISKRTLVEQSCDDSRDAAQFYWERAQLLEHELVKLDKLLNTEKELRNRVNNVNEIDCVKFKDKGIDKYNGTREILRVEDGGYLHNLNVDGSGWPCGKLAMQVSAPAVIPVEIGSSIYQVLNRMARMGCNNLVNWLLAAMPMCDISKVVEQIDTRTTPIAMARCSQQGFLEATLVTALEKLESLALEGLKTQMNVEAKLNKDRNRKVVDKGGGVGECVIEVLLIQMRDPKRGYEAVGNTMLGFIEANAGERKEGGGVEIQGVHVAGISGESFETNPTRGQYLWSISARNCEENYSSTFLRNPDIAFA